MDEGGIFLFHVSVGAHDFATAHFAEKRAAGFVKWMQIQQIHDGKLPVLNWERS